MFGCKPEEAGPAELHDALGAIVSVTAGNVKSLLPEPVAPALPLVFDGEDPAHRLTGVRVVTYVAFAWRGDRVEVALLRRSD